MVCVTGSGGNNSDYSRRGTPNRSKGLVPPPGRSRPFGPTLNGGKDGRGLLSMLTPETVTSAPPVSFTGIPTGLPRPGPGGTRPVTTGEGSVLGKQGTCPV